MMGWDQDFSISALGVTSALVSFRDVDRLAGDEQAMITGK